MEVNFSSKLRQNALWIVLLILLALFSHFVVSAKVSEPSYHAKAIESVNEKKAVVLKLAAASAATSTALTLLPGDIATPIAHQIAELSKYFLFILAVIFLEKVLLGVVGYISFSYIIPIACLLAIIYVLNRKKILLDLAFKLFVFGLIIFIAIPAGMKMGDLIYATNRHSIETVVDITENNKALIEEKGKDILAEGGFFDKISDLLSEIPVKIGSGITDAIKKGEDNFNAFLDAVATLIITTCVIPLLVMLLLVWLTMSLLKSFNLKLPDFKLSKKST